MDIEEKEITAESGNELQSIADNLYKPSEVFTSEDSKNQISMFLVAQARNELKRIIKLTNFLEETEDKFVDVATTLMQQYPDNLTLVQSVMETIEKSLNRSNELLTQILKDEKLSTYTVLVGEKQEEPKEKISSATRVEVMNFANTMLAKLDEIAKQDGEENV